MPAAQQMRLSLVLAPRHQNELKALLQRIYDPSSPDYHHYLTVAQFTEQFAPSAEEYQAVVDFAEANGFNVTDRAANRLIVPVSGTVAQVESAFHVAMKEYQHPTEARTFYSPDREPSLELSVPIVHIAGMNNYSLPRPTVVRGDAIQGLATSEATGSGPGGSYLASDMRAAYYTSTLPTGSTALTGAGQTVGLVEFDGYQISDVVSSFDGTATSSASGSNYILAYTPTAGGTTYSIPVNNVLLDGATGAPVEGDDAEEVLDIVQAIGMAPGLSQVRVYTGNTTDANEDADILNAIASEGIAQEVSISWMWAPDDPATDDIFFEEMAAQGQSVFAASGDNGAYIPAVWEYYPAEDAYVTAVGGTDLTTSGPGGSWVSETAWDRSGGGISPDQIPIPGWQVGIANSSNQGSTTYRNVPDVAMEADTDNYSCDMGACRGGWGGTSFAAPRWAAYVALANQQAASAENPALGFLNPTIYPLAESSTYVSDFHDITTGTNIYLEEYGFDAEAGYDLATGWGSPNGAGLVDSLAPTTTMNFLLTASAPELTVASGASGTETITIAYQNGFSGSVALAVSGLPAGVTGSFGTNPATGSSVLTVTVDDSAVRGSYLIQVTGTLGNSTASASFALEVNAPGFTITPESYSAGTWQGEADSVLFDVTKLGGFTGAVKLSIASPLPSGVTAFWKSSPPAAGKLALTFLASDTATEGSTGLTVIGISGNYTSSATLALGIGAPGFFLELTSIPFDLVQGGSSTALLSVVPVGDLDPSTPVTLSSEVLPAGITAHFNPQTINQSTESVVTIDTSDTATPGTDEEVALQGSAVNYPTTSFTYFTTVLANPVPTFTVGVNPTYVQVNQGGSATTSVNVTDFSGYSDEVYLLTTQNPLGLTSSFDTSPTASSSNLTLKAASTAPPGLYEMTLWGENSIDSMSALSGLFLLVKPVLDFSLGLSTPSLTIPSGDSGTATLTVTPQNGFTGTVNLSSSGLPDGISLSIGTNPTNGTSLLTLNVSSSVTAGSYYANITAADDTQTETITLYVNVSGSVTPTATSTSLSITPSGGTLTAGASYTLTATVTPGSGSTTPSGNVVFTIGSATQTVALNSSGVATYNGTAPAAAGTLTISAAYQGTSAFSASTSNTLNETITPAETPGFTVSGTAVTVAPGATAGNTSTITVTPSGGFTGSVALTAYITSSPTGAEGAPTMSFGSTTPVSITGTSAATATLTITTTAATSAAVVYSRGTGPKRPGLPWYVPGGAALFCILVFRIPTRARRWRTMPGMLALLTALTTGVLACGGGGSTGGGGTSSPGTTAGAYTITVTGISGTLTQKATVALTVNE
jgi:subtilase family serine protease